MRTTAPAIAGIIAGIAIALVWYFRTENEPRSAADNIVERAQETPETNSAFQDSPPADTTAARDTRAPAAAPAAAPSAEPAAAPAGRSTDVRPAPPPAPLPGETPVLPIAKLLEVLEQQAPPTLLQGEREFAAEAVDVDWASGAEAEILSRVSQVPDLALISMQVECRTTMCRLQAASPISPAGGNPPFTTLVDSIGLEPRWMMAIPDASGALQLVAYLRRE